MAGDLGAVLGAAAGMNTNIKLQNSTSEKAGKSLDMNDFLVLMCAMFQNQDIDNTASTTDMMNQMVQMSVVQAITDISSLISDSTTLTYASSLVGKEVVIGLFDSHNKLVEINGIVTGTGKLNGEQVVFLDNDNEKCYKLTDILAIGKLPEVPETEGDEGAENKPDTGDGDKTTGA